MKIEQRALNIADLRQLAKGRLPRGFFEYIDRGSEDDDAIVSNRAAYGKYKLRPRVLKNVSTRSMGSELFGKPLAMPMVVAPTGAAGLMWHQGELALAKAAASAGIPFTLSTASLTSLERIAAQAPGRLWFQLYMWPDKSMSHQLVKRAQDAGFEALVVTVDTVVAPNRECNTRNGFTLPFSVNRRNALDLALHSRWLITVVLRYMLTGGLPRLENFPRELERSLTGGSASGSALPKNDSLSWDDFRDLRKIWQGPLMVKGILHPKDALAAAEHGADGIIVSNHGGRNLDSSIAPLLALPDIVDCVGSRLQVLMDGGIMRGSDLVKALALGARAVMVGRAPLWGVAAAGQAGAAHALSILAREALRVMGQCGCSTVAELDHEILWCESQALVPDRRARSISLQ